MANFKDPEDVKLLLKACQQIGIDTMPISCSNPHEHSGKVAERIQISAAALDPIRAAKWAQDAGKTASAESVAALMGLTPITQAIHNDLAAVDPKYLASIQEQQQKMEAEQLAEMDRAADELHLRNLRAQHGSDAERVFAAEKQAEAQQQTEQQLWVR